MTETPEYAVPALDKALDILELLAAESGGRTQSEIADAVGRTVGQIFRVLTTLERRGYIFRDRQSGLYILSTRMFEIAHQHAPLRGLVVQALSPMRDLAMRISQSCNLSVLDADRALVIAQVESPADFGYRVRVGAAFPLSSTITGWVLVAGAPADVRASLGDGAVSTAASRTAAKQLAELGYVTRQDPLQAGITDVVVPVIGVGGSTVAALTVPYVATTFSASSVETVVRAAQDTGRFISDRMQGVAVLQRVEFEA